MTDRQFLWGLSNGIIALAIAEIFWIGLGLGPFASEAGWFLCALVSVVVYGSCAAVIWAAVRLRRRSGFRPSELKQADEHQRAQARKMMVGFRWIVVVQTILVALAVFLCVRLRHEEFLWPAIGLVVSLHFIPLGRIFYVRTYYFVGIVGGVMSLLTFSAPIGSESLMLYGAAMGILMLVSAIYLVLRADKICARAIRERWSA